VTAALLLAESMRVGLTIFHDASRSSSAGEERAIAAASSRFARTTALKGTLAPAAVVASADVAFPDASARGSMGFEDA